MTVEMKRAVAAAAQRCAKFMGWHGFAHGIAAQDAHIDVKSVKDESHVVIFLSK